MSLAALRCASAAGVGCWIVAAGRIAWAQAAWLLSTAAPSHSLLAPNCNALFVRSDICQLCVLMFFRGRYTSVAGFAQTWLPFCILAVVGGYFGQLVFLYVWAAVVAALVGWFCLHTWATRYKRAAM